MFNQSDIEQFIRKGYVILENGFDPEVAAAGREFIWAELGLSPHAPSTWTDSIIHIQKAYNDPPFDRVLNPRLLQAIAQLTGEDRADIHAFFGWWPVLFPGFAGPGGWHVDGSHFHHRLLSREQGLVTLYLFSDIEPGDGGTALVPGSHLEIARILSDAEPHGLSFKELMASLPEVDPDDSIEITGTAGDVALLHPFLIHGFGENRGDKVRFACNPQYSLREAMNLQRSDGQYSPVESAIRLALDLS